MKKILLTGGSGFIGRNLRESFLSQAYELCAPSHAELDLSDTDSTDAYFARHRFDAVIHAAVKPSHRNAPDPTAIFYTNNRIFFNLLRHADRCGRILNLGSGAIYDMRHYVPMMREDYFGCHVPVDEHGYNKYVCGKYIECCPQDVVDLRIFGIFGKYEDYAIRFISNAICKTLFDLPVTLRQERRFSYLYAPDLAPVLAWFIENKPRYKAYNITPDEVSSLFALAAQAVELSGKTLPIQVGSAGEGMPYTGCNARLREEMGDDLRFTSMEAAVEELYGWYVSIKDTLDRNCLLYDK
ncbi:MAG: NAD(P)-dependent oxidoreductase [Bacteroidales bacterium]|nr:NAD(P)-dependent oxidoreductase [Bacteroidales bacterium]